MGLCGAAGSGKSTVAARLRLTHGYASWAFAEPLYAAVAAITGLSAEQLQDRVVKEEPLPWLGASPRRLLQTLGTEWGRHLISETVWIDATFRRIDEAGAARNVICDVRFANEAQAIRDRGGIVIRVERPGKKCLAGQAAAHASEAGIPEEMILATIHNAGDVADLEAAVDALVRSLHEDTMK